MSHVRRILALAFAAWIAASGATVSDVAAATPGEIIAGAARKVVKLYGAGGVRGLEAYQTGILVSPGGHIVTVLSTVLDSDEIDCVLDDGRRYRAMLKGIDPRRELAVVTIDAEDLPAFVLEESAPLPTGSPRSPSRTPTISLARWNSPKSSPRTASSPSWASSSPSTSATGRGLAGVRTSSANLAAAPSFCWPRASAAT